MGVGRVFSGAHCKETREAGLENTARLIHPAQGQPSQVPHGSDTIRGKGNTCLEAGANRMLQPRCLRWGCQWLPRPTCSPTTPPNHSQPSPFPFSDPWVSSYSQQEFRAPSTGNLEQAVLSPHRALYPGGPSLDDHWQGHTPGSSGSEGMEPCLRLATHPSALRLS